MSVIQKIRDKYAKIAGGVIGLALVAFIISEGINGSFSNLFGHDTSVASVDGSRIDVREFSDMCRDYISLSEVFRKGQKMSEQEQAQLRQQVLDQMINEALVEKECEKLGITVSDAEQKDMISGQNPDQNVQQYFMTIFQSQQFDPNMVKQFEQEVKNRGAEEPKLVELGQQWLALKRFVIRGKLIEKYNVMLRGSVYTPKPILAHNNKMGDMQASFNFVKLPLTLIADTEAPVSEAEMKDYMKAHKAEYSTDQPSRSIDYIVYDVFPGPDDTAKALGVLETLKDEFQNTSNNEVFVNRHSEERFSPMYVNKDRYMSPMAETILDGSVGSVFGPFFEAGAYKLVKVIDRRQLPDSVKAQHILIATESQQNPNGLSDTLAHQRADSIYAAIKAGVNFDSLAVKFSDDPGSKEKGGDLGYFTYGTMVPEFNEACFMGSKGDLKEVKTQFGWHIIRVTDQKHFSPAVKLATIAKTLNIGAKADQEQFAKANEFAGSNRTGEAFDEAVKKNGLNKRIADNLKGGDYIIPGLGSAREIIRWAFAAKPGEVSDPIHLDNKYVVAKLSTVNEAGLKSLDAATKAQVEAAVRNKKKAELLATKYQGVSNLETLAQQSNQPVQAADSISATASFTPGLGFEPRVIGYAFSEKMQPGAVSPAITGKEGVYFIALKTRVSVPKAEDPQALAAQANMQDMQNRNALPQNITTALRRQADIKIKPANIF